ncbi:MAG TPA: carbohydrate porin [Frateuria sp.]|uniref:carbohydrate porin n=1 Tax=Frateuria sp. TaxID=2211372 RepID=UPI002DF46B01|nr:carbohydrate porin [Frateuria sp.]
MKRSSLCASALVLGSAFFLRPAMADEQPRLWAPQLLGAQYTFIDQHQGRVHSPYAGPLSLRAQANQARSHTFGVYFGMPVAPHAAVYLDVEMFRGEGVSNATGLAGLTNGDVIRGGGSLSRNAYVARAFVTYDIPLGDATTEIKRKMDQLPGQQADHRLGFKFGLLAVNDDFDQSRYANSTRTQFLNWGLFNNLAWDFAADTRGYTVGGVATYANGPWIWRYGVYQMPVQANGQKLEGPIWRARNENLQLTWQADANGPAVWLLAFRNKARMGIYRTVLARAAQQGTTPDIRSDDRDGRHKYGIAAGFDLPLADDGDTGLFGRWGWNDGKTESFVFTEADRNASFGGQMAGARWNRPRDRIALAFVVNGLSPDHRRYLAAGGSGFVLGDGRLNYGEEQIAEAYYELAATSFASVTADVQFIRHPGYNRDRGPARFVGLRVHLEY